MCHLEQVSHPLLCYLAVFQPPQLQCSGQTRLARFVTNRVYASDVDCSLCALCLAPLTAVMYVIPAGNAIVLIMHPTMLLTKQPAISDTCKRLASLACSARGSPLQ